MYSCSQQDHSAIAETDIKLVPIADLHDFEGHPFKVENDMALFELMQSIEKEGVIVPALARPRAEGGYELIAGHRRKAASKWAGLDVMPVVIRELDNNQAVIAMVDSNLQREHLKPSEKAFAYKMKLDAMKRQGARTDLTFCQVGEKLENPTLQTHSLAGGYDADGKWMLLQDKSVEDAIIRSNQSLAMQTGESQRQISRYIRLTNLIPRTVLFLWEKVSYKLHTESAKPLAKNKVCLQALFFCHKAEASWGLGMPNPQQVPARVYTGRNLLYLMRRIRSLCRLRSARISGNRISFGNDAQSCSRISYGERVLWIYCKTGV